MQEKREPVTIAEAAQRLDKVERTVRTWASRYHARKLLKPGRVGRTAYYDWHDLATIARQIYLGEPVPATPEERDVIRRRIRAGAASAA